MASPQFSDGETEALQRYKGHMGIDGTPFSIPACLLRKYFWYIWLLLFPHILLTRYYNFTEEVVQGLLSKANEGYILQHRYGCFTESRMDWMPPPALWVGIHAMVHAWRLENSLCSCFPSCVFVWILGSQTPPELFCWPRSHLSEDEVNTTPLAWNSDVSGNFFCAVTNISDRSHVKKKRMLWFK